MKNLFDLINRIDWFSLLLSIGLGLFCLISLVRCALKD